MRYRKYIFGLILFICCPAIASSRLVPDRHAGACVGMFTAYRYTWPLRSGHGAQALAARDVNVQRDAASDQFEYGSEEWHEEKSKLEVMIWASAIILTILFLGLVLITFIRMGRHYRKRVTGDKKPAPTDYVDAWSQYRLEDDNDENN